VTTVLSPIRTVKVGIHNTESTLTRGQAARQETS
jgi:hypothetical protein